jgi:hypothetical protein
MWSIFKIGVFCFLLLFLFLILGYICAQHYVTERLNAKLEGEARSQSDVVVQARPPPDKKPRTEPVAEQTTYAPVTSEPEMNDEEFDDEDELDVGYISD